MERPKRGTVSQRVSKRFKDDGVFHLVVFPWEISPKEIISDVIKILICGYSLYVGKNLEIIQVF